MYRTNFTHIVKQNSEIPSLQAHHGDVIELGPHVKTWLGVVSSNCIGWKSRSEQPEHSRIWANHDGEASKLNK